MATNKYTLGNTRTRTLLIIVIIMVITGTIVAIYSFSSKGNKNNVVPTTSGVPTNVQVTPGAKSSEKYVALQQAANIAGTKQADSQGKNFIPTIIGNKTDDTSKNFNAQLTDILKEKNTNNADIDKLSKQLASLLATLNGQGDAINNLLHLIQDLQKRGYNVEDLEALMKQLMKDGYNTDDLAKLLAQLRQQGYKVNDLEDMLRRLLKEGYDPDLINKLLEQMLRDRLKALEDAIKQLQNAGYDTKNIPILQQQVNNPDLTKLLEQLANQGYKMNSLEDLLKQLMDKGYNISDWNITVQQLQKGGYDVDKLKALLDQLKAQGIEVKSLKDLLDALSKKNQANKPNQTSESPHKPNISNQLSNFFNTNPATNNNQPKLGNPDIDKEYAAMLKKQHDAAIAEENNQKQAEENALREKRLALTSEAKQKAIEDMIKNMGAETDAATSVWNKIPSQAFVQGDLANNKDKDDSTGKQILSGTPSQSLLGNQQTANISKDSIIKAGSILFAVLETAVNSDEPGPILARIVQPPLMNTKLIGSVQPTSSQYSETLALTFNTANIPNLLHSSSISAVAIDPNTARTALASDVDHHYLLRWGTVFAATFLQGYSSGIAQAGTTVNTATTGSQTNTVTQQSPLSPRQSVFKGISDVASAWGQGASQLTNRPNTITINAGVSLGILFTSDFTIPSSDEASSQTQQPPIINPTSQTSGSISNINNQGAQNLPPSTNMPSGTGTSNTTNNQNIATQNTGIMQNPNQNASGPNKNNQQNPAATPNPATPNSNTNNNNTNTSTNNR